MKTNSPTNRFAKSIGLALPLLIAVSNVVTAQAECDYQAWLTANPGYTTADTPLPADSLDELPRLTAWPDSLEKHALAEVNRAGWKWDATLQVVVDTNGTVLEAEVVLLDIWADGPTDMRSTFATLDQLAVTDSIDVLLTDYMRNVEFSPAAREGNHVTAFLCPNMSAAVMSPAPRDDMGFSIIGPTFFAIQVRDGSAAAEWYRNALGLRQINHLAVEDGSYSIRNLTGGDLTVELVRLPGTAPAPAEPHLGLFKAGFFVDDIAAAFKWLRSQSVDTDERIMVDREMQVRMFVFRDLAGKRLQVFERCGEGCGRGLTSPRSATQSEQCVLNDASHRLSMRVGRARPLRAGHGAGGQIVLEVECRLGDRQAEPQPWPQRVRARADPAGQRWGPDRPHRCRRDVRALWPGHKRCLQMGSSRDRPAEDQAYARGTHQADDRRQPDAGLLEVPSDIAVRAEMAAALRQGARSVMP